jgi:peroxidase
LDGTCNNLANPSWGAANNPYARLLPAKYSDGVAAPTVSVTGKPLPSPRAISVVVFRDDDAPDPQFTLANMQWGQIITHDMSRTVGPVGIRCCTADGKFIPREAAHPACLPIWVSKNDPIYSYSGIECLNFVRSSTDRGCPNAQKSKAEQFTEVTNYLDLSLVYGSSDEQLGPIRAFHSGRMLVEQRLGQEWPPQNPNATCNGNQGETCYLAGDGRVNQNPGLTVLQIILLREHNIIADGLKTLNSHWNDEILFQEARRINIAQYQHISYWEWLPIFLGKAIWRKKI